MIFFLSFMPAGEQEEFLSWVDSQTEKEDPALASRLRPASAGLTRAFRGLPVVAPPTSEEPYGACRFLGWSSGTHWFMS